MNTRLTAGEVIALLDLKPLEGEGGYYRETWSLPDPSGDRPLATSIYYLVTPTSFSALHRLDHDETFHVYAGDPCRMAMIDLEGRLHEVVLGQDIADGMRVQHVVPRGWWQGTRLRPGGQWALLGTTNVPGFVPEGFELATVKHLEEMSGDVQDAVRDLVVG